MTYDEEFRFSSKKEYEKNMAGVLNQLNKARARKSPSARKDEIRLEAAYEELVEEYLRFCGEEEDG